MRKQSALEKVLMKFKIGLFDSTPHLSDFIEIIYRKDSSECLHYANTIFIGLTQKKRFRNVCMIARDYMPYLEELAFENKGNFHRVYVNCK